MKKLIYDGEKYEEFEVIGKIRVTRKIKGMEGKLYDCVKLTMYTEKYGKIDTGLAISANNTYVPLPENPDSKNTWEMVEVYNEYVWEEYQNSYKSAVIPPEELDEYLMDDEEKNYTTKYLPIGSVIKLDNYITDIMIVAVDPTQEKCYIGCRYPEGILTNLTSEKYVYFDNRDITSLEYCGFLDSNEKAYKEKLERNTNHTK